jgi:hypothetical protein
MVKQGVGMLDWLHTQVRKSNLDNIDDLESSLEAAFRPVEPSPEFVRDLRRNLVSFPSPVTVDPDSKIPLYMALVIASLLSGVAIIGIGVWIILVIVGKSQPHGKRMASSPDPVG